MKKIVMYLIQTVSVLVMMLAFAFLSMYVIFILHELGHAFCGYLTGYRLVAFGLGNFLLTKKSGRLHLSRTAVIKMLVLSILV